MTWELLGQLLILAVVLTGCAAFLIVMWSERAHLGDTHYHIPEIGIPDRIADTPKGRAIVAHFDVHPQPVAGCEMCAIRLQEIGE